MTDYRATIVKSLKRVSGEFWSLLSEPEYLVVILGLVFGLLILIFTPPFMACDEPQHIYNSYKLSEGRVLYTKSQDMIGSYIPASFYQTFNQLNVEPMISSSVGKASPDLIVGAFKIPLRAGDKIFMAGYIQYPPLCYIPQAIGMAIGHLFRGPPILLIYLGRLFNLLAVLFIAFITIRITPLLKWTFFLLFMMPVTLFQASSNSADGMTIAISFLAAAFFFRLAFDPSKESLAKKDMILLVVLTLALATIKMPYFLIIFGFFIIPWKRFGSKRKYLLTFGAMLLVVFILFALWQLVIVRAAAPAGAPAIPGANSVLTETLSHPINFLKLQWHRMSLRGLYMSEMVESVGWWNVDAQWWLWPLFMFTLIAVTALDKRDDIVVKRWQRALSLVLFLGIIEIIIVLLHIMMDPVNATFTTAKDWLNGRYFIPALTFGALVLYNKSIAYKKTRFFYVAVNGLTLVFLIATVTMIIQRFY